MNFYGNHYSTSFCRVLSVASPLTDTDTDKSREQELILGTEFLTLNVLYYSSSTVLLKVVTSVRNLTQDPLTVLTSSYT